MKFHTANIENLDQNTIRPGVVEIEGEYIAVLVLGKYPSLEAAQTETELWWSFLARARA